MATQTDEDLRSLMRHPDYGRFGVVGDHLRDQVRAGFAERYPGPLERDATGRQVDGASSFIGRDLPGLRDGNVTVTEAGLAAAAHREGARAVRRYLEHRAGNNPIPTSIPGQLGDLSRFNEIERRLRAFEQTPYEARR